MHVHNVPVPGFTQAQGRENPTASVTLMEFYFLSKLHTMEDSQREDPVANKEKGKRPGKPALHTCLLWRRKAWLGP